MRTLARHAPLIALLGAQAAVSLFQLGLLPAWMDELHTIQVAALPWRAIPAAVAADIHPPLYFLLARTWPWHSLEGLRAFSVAWAVAATLLLDLCWTRRWRPSRRWTALALFAFSPCLLLYGRMARSYSMQAALAVIAVYLLWRWARAEGGLGVAALASCLLLYTHYAPGLAVAGAFVVLGWRKRGWRAAGLLTAALVAGCLPWLATLGAALGRWGAAASYSASYYLSGSAWLETLVKAAFGGISLAIGETFHPVSLLVAPLSGWAAWRGGRIAWRRAPGLTAAALVAALIGFAGVARWVSYAFVPARLVWALPFVSLAAAIALARKRRRFGVAVLGASFLSSTVCYFRGAHYLNHGYQAPVREIAQRLNKETRGADVVLVDGYNTDNAALRFYYAGAAPLEGLTPEGLSRAEGARAVWVVRNQHDASPGQASSRLEEGACAPRRAEVHLYLPYPAWQRAALRLLLPAPPTHFYRLAVCR